MQAGFHSRPCRIRCRRRLALAGATSLVLVLVVLLLPDRRSAWEQAPLTRGRRPPEDPVSLSLWANELGPLLREAEALGPMPQQREPLLRWLTAQCSITLRLQALQRRFGKPVETAEQMGRPPYCEDLPRPRSLISSTIQGAGTRSTSPLSMLITCTKPGVRLQGRLLTSQTRPMNQGRPQPATTARWPGRTSR
jgi:hypothetical protein